MGFKDYIYASAIIFGVFVFFFFLSWGIGYGIYTIPMWWTISGALQTPVMQFGWFIETLIYYWAVFVTIGSIASAIALYKLTSD